MRAIQKISVAAILAIGTAGVGLVSVAQGQEHQAIVAERLGVMKNIGKHFGAIKKAAAAGDAVQVESNANDLVKLSRAITGLFPTGDRAGQGSDAGQGRYLDQLGRFRCGIRRAWTAGRQARPGRQGRRQGGHDGAVRPDR